MSDLSGLDRAEMADGFKLIVSLPPSQGDYPHRSLNQKYLTYIHQFHQGEKRGILSQPISTVEQNVVRHYLTLKNLTGFKA